MINVEHICERKYFYWATWEGWMNLFLLSYPKYIIKYNCNSNQYTSILVVIGPCRGVPWCRVPCGPLLYLVYTKHYCNNMSII